jgi:hypothetical protein
LSAIQPPQTNSLLYQGAAWRKILPCVILAGF